MQNKSLMLSGKVVLTVDNGIANDDMNNARKDKIIIELYFVKD